MSIVLTKYAAPLDGVINGDKHTWPMRVTATSTTDGLPSEIFVYHVGAATMVAPNDPHPGDRCEAIASVHQLQELPAGAPPNPGEASVTPYYRSASAFFHCHSMTEYERLWGVIQDDARDLLENFMAMQALVAEETVSIDPSLEV